MLHAGGSGGAVFRSRLASRRSPPCLLLVIALIAWSLASGIFPSQVAGRTTGWYWAAGMSAAILFMASLLAHELAHSVVAQRLGVRVEGITLWCEPV